jgi:hypothetical protein
MVRRYVADVGELRADLYTVGIVGVVVVVAVVTSFFASKVPRDR